MPPNTDPKNIYATTLKIGDTVKDAKNLVYVPHNDSADVWVIDPTPGSMLTLISCYPFQYIGHAPERFIVRAERIPRTLAALRPMSAVLPGAPVK